MTSRQLFEYALLELNKSQAPSLLLEDYNYFMNKTILQYINKIYNSYDINQQRTDDLRVLKSSAVLPASLAVAYTDMALYNAVYETDLPDDYLHILNCVVEYTVARTFKCYNFGDIVHFGARRLTADMFSQIINNYYMRPTYKAPYYFINNVNIQNTFPTTDNQEPLGGEFIKNSSAFTTITDGLTYVIGGITFSFVTSPNPAIPTQVKVGANNPESILNLFNKVNSSTEGNLTILDYNYTSTTLEVFSKDSIIIGGTSINTTTVINSRRQKSEQLRYGNRSKVRMEIRYGKDNSLFVLNKIYIDYLKAPQFIRLTQSEIDEVVDNSQILEFPDYVCQEIVNGLIWLLLENSSDPRLQTNIPINQSIANPAQEQQQQQSKRR